MEFRARQTLTVSREVAFDVLADLRTQSGWSRAPIEAELLTGEPVGLGSRFQATQGGRDYEATITTYERAERLGIEVRGAHLQIQGDFRFRAAGPGSVLEAVVELSAKGPMRFVLPTFRSRIAAEVPQEAESFARFCAAWAAS